VRDLNALPFQYGLRGRHLAEDHGQILAAAHETRDRDLEDFLGQLVDRIDALEARGTALEP